MREWREHEIQRCKQLLQRGWPYVKIAKVLGRTEMSVRAFVIRANRSAEEKRIQQDKENAWRVQNRRDIKFRSDYITTGIVHDTQVRVSSRPTDQMLAERDARAAMPYRDLTASFLGDPPLGRSALDCPPAPKRRITLAGGIMS